MPTWRAFAFDVNNMFTELPHGAIASAASDGVQLYQHTCDTALWDVHRRRRTAVPCTGRSKPPSGCIRISLPQLLPALLFELQHTFICVGDQVLQQTKGAAMGGFISPAMAMLVCIAAERRLHEHLGPHVADRIAGF